MRRFTVFALTALVALWATASYAEVQNVKVSGKVDITGAYRDAYVVQGAAPLAAGYDEDAAQDAGAGDYFFVTGQVKISADLTDNVSAVIAIRSQREYGGTGDGLDTCLAYIELKEFLYSPLSLKAGLMPFRMGSLLILGDGTPGSNLTYSDLSLKKGFDVISLNYALDNGNVTLAYMRPRGSYTPDDRDGDIWVADVNLDLKPATLELYYVLDASDEGVNGDNVRDYIGGRVVGQIMEGLTGTLEIAYLFGDYYLNGVKKDYDAWAVDLGLAYTINDKANVGATLIYRSGDKDLNSGDYEAWYAPYEDQVIGEIADKGSNVIALKLSGSAKVMEDVTLAADYYHFWADEDVAYGNVSKDDDLGDELDVYLTWDYTSDVQMGLTVAAYWPGKAYEKDDTAVEVLGSMTVSF